MNPDFDNGPLLAGLLDVHKMNEEALEGPQLERLAAALVTRCCDLGRPLIWPVGDAATRLAGAAVLVAKGDIKIRGWVDDIRGTPVLLASLAAATPLEMVDAARHARALGASAVHAFGWNVADMSSPGFESAFDSCFALCPGSTRTALRLAS